MKQHLLVLLALAGMVSVVKAQNPPTFYGTGAGTLGMGSSYFGYQAGKSVIGGEGAESYNSFFGELSGQATTMGLANTAMGYHSLYSVTTQSYNTAIGFRALRANQASGNTGVGCFSLAANTTGYYNTAVGTNSLEWNSVGFGNSAFGDLSLNINRTGNENTAIGNFALRNNNNGSNNTSVGAWAGNSNDDGSYNTATGHKAMSNNSSGNFNSAYGILSLDVNESGSLNSAFGAFAGPALSNLTNTTALGYFARPTASNQVRIGNNSVTSIGGKVSWSTLSDGRFKREVREDISGLEFIKQLRPVSYVVDDQAINKFLRITDHNVPQDNAARTAVTRQTGFIAQEVEAVIKKTGFVFGGVEVPQNDGDHYSIRYAEFVVPLVKAVQELSKEIEVLKQKLAETELSNGTESNDKAILFQNTPNPSSGDTEIKMSVPEEVAQASVIVYNLEGKQLKAFPIHGRGNVAVKILAHELSSGMYLYTLINDGKVVDTKRMILIE